MPTELLLFTARAERDVLGQSIGRFESGTFTHAALYRNGQMVDAVWPRVRMIDGQASEWIRMGASEVVPFSPWSESHDAAVWAALLGHVVGQSYGLSTLLLVDVLGNWIGHQAVVRLGGAVVCSVLAGQYARLVGDPRIPIWAEVASLTPADLGRLFVGRRAHREAA